ncbi:MAG: DUF998 domain-containing protein [candidate division WOR-3 bacterium]|nr:MAG: DUF998 domain-containing protein [candidate division WOR-3 bacterium]
MNKRLLFWGGIFGPTAFLLNDIIGGIVTPNYSYIENTISDLTKAGTQHTYLLGSIILLISALMGIAFGIGIISRFQYKHAKLVFLGGLFLVIIGIFTGLTGTIFPQDPIGQELTFPGTVHIILVGISLLLTFPALLMIGIGLDKTNDWRAFRLYTFISVIISFIFGGLSAILAFNEIALLGLVERISVYTIQIWIAILAYRLITEERRVQIDLETNSSN